MKLNTLAALTGIYSDDPYRNYDDGQQVRRAARGGEPERPEEPLRAWRTSTRSSSKIDEAEETYKKVDGAEPERRQGLRRPGRVLQQAALGRRRRARNRLASSTRRSTILERCAQPRRPTTRSGYQKVATFYWDKAYRDPLLNDEQKDAYADKGLEAVDKALALKPDYFEAVIYKGLLFRVKAQVAQEPAAAAAVPGPGADAAEAGRWS